MIGITREENGNGRGKEEINLEKQEQARRGAEEGRREDRGEGREGRRGERPGRHG